MALGLLCMGMKVDRTRDAPNFVLGDLKKCGLEARVQQISIIYGSLCAIGAGIGLALILVASNDGIYFVGWCAALGFILGAGYFYANYNHALEQEQK